MKLLISAMTGYLVGGINPSYISSKLKKFDIRDRGSGNAGASNAFITMGAKMGVLVALLDIFKAVLVVKVLELIFPEAPFVREIGGVACILGHIFPIYMRFKGGKGLACLGGVLAAFDWRLFIAVLLGEIILALVVDYICVVPLTASVLLPLVYFFKTGSGIGSLILCIATFAIFYAHRRNLHRIATGTEAHLSFIWNRKKEISRIEKKTAELEKSAAHN